MNSKQRVAAMTLLALLGLVAFGLVRTSGAPASAAGDTTAASGADTTVDQRSLQTAEQMARLTSSVEELPFAQEAVRLADLDMDLAFAIAVREAAAHPPVVSPEAKAISDRLQAAESAADAQRARIARLSAAIASAGGSTTSVISDRLDLAKAQLDLDQDEVDDAKQDLLRAGGDPQGRLQAMMDQHTAASSASDSTRVTVHALPETAGLIHWFERWSALHQERGLLDLARRAADSAAIAFASRHTTLDQQMGGAPSAESVATGDTNHAATRAALEVTRRRAADQQTLSSLDKRVLGQQGLSANYARWIGVVRLEERAAINSGLHGVTVILLMLLIGLFFDRWLEGLLARLSVDGRRWHTLQMVTRVSLQVIGALLVVIVVFGPPENLGTFLGLAGAGLTVALKDFLVGFFGWFVLMGRNGIRLGDWVEINGVTGEVVELGIFHTVLMETGDLAETNHPTGRRVSFMNTFAVEGHYFNFSTSGRWLWDDVRFTVPAGTDPYAVAAAMQQRVTEVTKADAAEAVAEWNSAGRPRGCAALTAAPTVTVRPTANGAEIAARYVTRADDRHERRALLYRAAMDLLNEHARAATP